MRGRDPHEPHRVTTPLELLFDLTFVIAYGTAASQLAHMLAAGHIGAGIGGFAFASFAIAWAWINFAWFASAYDVDDWGYRLLTMLQMVGVLILALGLPAMFASFEHEDINNRVMVLGYVIMRVPMVAQWVRAGRQDPRRRASSRIYILSIVVSQIVWCILVLFPIRIGTFFLLASVPLALELAGPLIAERKYGGTPWHPHHIAERYSLVVIIALGESIVGTMAALAAVIGPEGPGWSLEVAVLGLAGTALTFGMWWIYFVIPSGEMLAAYRERSFGWGYGHMLVFASIVAVGAGLHVAAFAIEHHNALSLPKTLLCTAVPLAIYTAMIFALYSAVTRSYDPSHKWMALGSAIPIVASVVMACASVGLAWCVAVLALSPWSMVVGYELVGHRHNERMIREAAEARRD
ncbi:MAG: low temperature requirement protein A [Kofleriaceae bacterium]|nr:low temperature requirement protein A [Kofleriaceae bacterium]